MPSELISGATWYPQAVQTQPGVDTLTLKYTLIICYFLQTF